MLFFYFKGNGVDNSRISFKNFGSSSGYFQSVLIFISLVILRMKILENIPISFEFEKS